MKLEPYKWCPKCGQWKLISEFHKNKRSHDDHASQCKLCAMARLEPYKWCSKCEQWTPISEFYKNKNNKDAYDGCCKLCTTVTNNKWNENNPEKYKAVRKKWYENNREKINATKRKNYQNNIKKRNAIARNWRKNNSQKYNSHKTLNCTISRGELERDPCEVCGTTKNIQGHHEDYSKPLEVNWLCASHHKKYHLDIGGITLGKDK
jgi:hypothetical protein